MNPPKTYAEWIDIISVFKSGTNDERIVELMKKGSIQWQSGVAERFSQKLLETFNGRMNDAIDKFQLSLSRSHGNEGMIINSIVELRKELSFLADAIDLPTIPEEHRSQFVTLIAEQADNVQKSLEDSSRNDRTGRLSSIIRNNRVNDF